jgi:diguanylate cyclase (GGDEF)-like protein
MPNTDLHSAMAAGERIRRAYAGQPLQIEDQSRAVTLSIGVAVLSPLDSQFSQLLQRADRAMYAAKNGGRNQVLVNEPALEALGLGA